MNNATTASLAYLRFERLTEYLSARGITLTSRQERVALNICQSLERLQAGCGKTMLLEALNYSDK